jgi:isoamylase
VRAFWKGDEGRLADFATRLTGSADLFDRRRRKPWASVNFVTAHDGFTLNDLVSYKRQAQPREWRGQSRWKQRQPLVDPWGRGPDRRPRNHRAARAPKRNFLATLLLSQGTPMLLVGDEFGRTQQGNNNAYCQDNEVSWVDWNHDENGRGLTRSVARLAALRSQYSVLRQSRFLTGKSDEALGVKDSTWLTPAGEEMTSEHWRDASTRCVGLLLDGRAQTSGIS